jgi:hypothetical protein
MSKMVKLSAEMINWRVKAESKKLAKNKGGKWEDLSSNEKEKYKNEQHNQSKIRKLSKK